MEPTGGRVLHGQEVRVLEPAALRVPWAHRASEDPNPEPITSPVLSCSPPGRLRQRNPRSIGHGSRCRARCYAIRHRLRGAGGQSDSKATQWSGLRSSRAGGRGPRRHYEVVGVQDSRLTRFAAVSARRVQEGPMRTGRPRSTRGCGLAEWRGRGLVARWMVVLAGRPNANGVAPGRGAITVCSVSHNPNLIRHGQGRPHDHVASATRSYGGSRRLAGGPREAHSLTTHPTKPFGPGRRPQSRMPAAGPGLRKPRPSS